MKTIKFSKDFKKLENENFTTIRKNDKKYKLHEIVQAKTPTKEFNIEVIGMQVTEFGRIHPVQLCADLDIDFNYFYEEQSYEWLLEQFKPFLGDDLTVDTVVYFYHFKKV